MIVSRCVKSGGAAPWVLYTPSPYTACCSLLTVTYFVVSRTFYLSAACQGHFDSWLHVKDISAACRTFSTFFSPGSTKL